MLFSLVLYAQEASDQPKQAPPGGLFDPTFLLTMLAIGVLFYFLMLRPMRRQEQERKRLLSAVKKNDKVVTSGGIIGTVAAVKDKEDEVTLRVDDSSNVRIRVTKSSIVRVLGEESTKESKEGGA